MYRDGQGAAFARALATHDELLALGDDSEGPPDEELSAIELEQLTERLRHKVRVLQRTRVATSRPSGPPPPAVSPERARYRTALSDWYSSARRVREEAHALSAASRTNGKPFSVEELIGQRPRLSTTANSAELSRAAIELEGHVARMTAALANVAPAPIAKRAEASHDVEPASAFRSVRPVADVTGPALWTFVCLVIAMLIGVESAMVQQALWLMWLAPSIAMWLYFDCQRLEVGPAGISFERHKEERLVEWAEVASIEHHRHAFVDVVSLRLGGGDLTLRMITHRRGEVAAVVEAMQSRLREEKARRSAPARVAS